MAYAANNLNLCIARMGECENLANAGYSSASWAYRDLTANDNLAAMQVDAFISDGDDQGIRQGDVIDFIEDGVGAVRMLVTLVTAGAVDTVAFA